MGYIRKAYSIFKVKTLHRRPRRICDDNIEMDVSRKECGIVKWIHLCYAVIVTGGGAFEMSL
jgi:hypothetical protein